MKPKKTPKYKMLHNRLSLALHIAEHLTEEERTHAEAMLSKRTEARMWINNYKYKQTQAAQSGGYSQKFWDAHEKWNTSDAAPYASSCLRSLPTTVPEATTAIDPTKARIVNYL